MDGREDVGPKMFKQCADLDEHWWRLYERWKRGCSASGQKRREHQARPKKSPRRPAPTEQEEPFGLLDLALIMNTTVSVSFLNQKVYLCFSLVWLIRTAHKAYPQLPSPASGSRRRRRGSRWWQWRRLCRRRGPHSTRRPVSGRSHGCLCACGRCTARCSSLEAKMEEEERRKWRKKKREEEKWALYVMD